MKFDERCIASASTALWVPPSGSELALYPRVHVVGPDTRFEPLPRPARPRRQVCAYCGSALPPDALKCPNCGAPLREAAP